MNDDSNGFSAGALARRALKRLPGGGFVQEQLDKIEHRVMAELKQRLDKVERGATVSVLAFSVQGEAAGTYGAHAPGALLRELMEASVEQNREQARQAYYVAALKSLVPDEARILSALSDAAYPLVHLLSSNRLGGGSHTVLRDISNVGRNAGAQLAELGGIYIGRLRQLGLVQTVAEDPQLKTKYEILETDGEVRKLIEGIRARGRREVLVRRTLVLSELGRALWDACRISED